jgi:hypothetical protein
MGPQALTHAPRPRTSSRTSQETKPGPGLSRILVPVRYSAWLSGDLGEAIERTLQAALDPIGPVRITRMARALLVEAPEEPGPLLEAVHRATLEIEAGVEEAYPVLHHEMGPVWTGTLQAVFT